MSPLGATLPSSPYAPAEADFRPLPAGIAACNFPVPVRFPANHGAEAPSPPPATIRRIRSRIPPTLSEQRRAPRAARPHADPAAGVWKPWRRSAETEDLGEISRPGPSLPDHDVWLPKYGHPPDVLARNRRAGWFFPGARAVARPAGAGPVLRSRPGRGTLLWRHRTILRGPYWHR